MLYHYLKIVWRNVLRKKLYATINIFGLSVGLSVCIVISLLIKFELSYDRFHDEADRIYRVYTEFTGTFSGLNRGVVTGAGPYVKENFTGVEQVVAFHNLWTKEVVIPQSDGEPKKFREEVSPIVTDKAFFELFDSYRWVAGDPHSALSAVNQVVLSEAVAHKYFGSDMVPADVLGRTVIYRDSITAVVTGVVKAVNKNSDFRFSEFISLPTANRFGIQANGWRSTNSSSQLFVKLAEGRSTSDIETQMVALVEQYREQNKDGALQAVYRLQPLADIHYNVQLGIFDSHDDAVNKATLKILALLALLILMIASINFVNLETAQSVKRSKEIGVRKVLGSSRRNLILQFLTESLAMTAMAVAVALPISQFAFSYFREFLPAGLTLDLSDGETLLFIGGLVVAVSLLSGAYPAFVMSRFLPARALKNQVFSEKGKNYSALLRKALTIFQFTFSQVLIAGSILMMWQMNYLTTKEMGFKKDEIVIVATPWTLPQENAERLANELAATPGVIEVLLSQNSPPASTSWSTNFATFTDSLGREHSQEVSVKRGGVEYFSFYEIPFVAGRPYVANDSIAELVINETFARQLGVVNPEDAIGSPVEWQSRNYSVVGVVRDFHHRTLHTEIGPLVMQYKKGGSNISLKVDAASDKDAINRVVDRIKSAWPAVYPNDPVEYSFLDEVIGRFYESERRTAKLAGTATILAVVISCLGLFGLVSFSAAQRTKEIGIRKVLGATASNIILLLSTGFLKLVLVAFALAAPLAYWLGTTWLEDFAYQIPVGPLLFIVTGLSALLIALLTVSQQAYKAANENPVKALRYE